MQIAYAESQGRDTGSNQSLHEWQPSFERQSMDPSTGPNQVSYVDTSYKSELRRSREAQKAIELSYAETSNENCDFQSKRTSLA